MGRKPAASSASPSGEVSAASPSALVTVSLPSAPSRTASASASTAGGRHAVVARERQQRLAAALDVEHERAVDEHDQRSGLARRLVAALGLALAARAGQRRTGWPGRWRRARPRGPRRGAGAAGWCAASHPPGTGVSHSGVSLAGLAAASARMRSTAPGRGELRRAEALDEVAAPHPPGLLERLEHRVDGGEAAGRALGDTAPRVTTPWRSSSASASACVRRVASVSRSGRRDQRPATVGGPVRVGMHRPAVRASAAAPAPRGRRVGGAARRRAACAAARACRW